MTRTISFITVVGAALALAAPAFGQGAQYSFERPQWQQALEARSEGMNKKYGLGDYDPAIRALKLRSEELNRQHGLGEYAGSAYPASTVLIEKALDNPVPVAGKDASDKDEPRTARARAELLVSGRIPTVRSRLPRELARIGFGGRLGQRDRVAAGRDRARHRRPADDRPVPGAEEHEAAPAGPLNRHR